MFGSPEVQKSRSPEVRKSSHYNKLRFELEVQKEEVQKSSHYNKMRFELEVQKEEVPKSGHYNKQRRSVGIPADEATSVVAGLVPATSHLYCLFLNKVDT